MSPEVHLGAPGQPVVARLVREGFTEGVHHGVVVARDVHGEVLLAHGPVADPMLPRSVNKPLQAVAMVRHGLDLPPEQLALAAASHSGEPQHVEVVSAVLASVGLDASALANPEDWPLIDSVRDEVLRAGGAPSRLLMNCSGKHAAMLVTCMVNGWPTDGYLDPAHPLQQTILAELPSLTGEPVAVATTDGCGAPLLAVSPLGLAHAFGLLARAEASTAEGRVAAAMRAHPELVSGSTRDEAVLHRAVPGLVTKAGAEAVQAVGLPDGRGIALKIADGSPRARPVLMAAALERIGALDLPGVDAGAVRGTGRHEVRGGGRVLGAVEAVLP